MLFFFKVESRDFVFRFNFDFYFDLYIYELPPILEVKGNYSQATGV